MNITARVDLVEVIWTAASSIGLLLALDLLEQARYDFRIVSESEPSSSSKLRQWRLECAIVHGDVVSALYIVAQEVISVAIGIVSLMTKQPPGGRTPFGWTIIGGLLFISILLPSRLYDARRRRRRLGVGFDRSDRAAS